jgi:hypothetical protein
MGSIAVFKDPEGNMMGLYQPAKSAAKPAAKKKAPARKAARKAKKRK